MYQHKHRRFRHRSNGRGHQARNKEGAIVRFESDSFLNGRLKNNFKTQQSAEKLAEKYNILAKEALSSGDKTASENYFQHADHFMRVIGDKNRNQNQNPNQNKPQVIDKQTQDTKLPSDNSAANQDNGSEKKEE